VVISTICSSSSFIKIIWKSNYIHISRELGQCSQYRDWLQAGQLRGQSSSPVRVKNFVVHVVQTSSGVHPASYPMGIGGSFPKDKAAGV
jgi:hypothetical protein